MKIKIQDPIHGAIEVSELEKMIIDSAPFQRLRRIRQLGNVHLVYPGATHTRASHSLGVMHTAGLLVKSLFKEAYKSKDREVLEALSEVKKVVRLAGLLHDLGHGAYSHLFHSVYSRKTVSNLDSELRIPQAWFDPEIWKNYVNKKLEHEDFSYAIIHYLENNLSSDIPSQDICALLEDKIKQSTEFSAYLEIIGNRIYECGDVDSIKDCLKSIMSGEVDADRLDYLQRDSHFCGIKTSGIDLSHLLSSLHLDTYKLDQKTDPKKTFCIRIDANAVSTVETMLIARKKMFDQVYNHRVNASCDIILERIFDFLVTADQALDCPTSYFDFIRIDDSTIDSLINELILDKTVPAIDSPELAARLFVSRTLLKKIYEKTVAIHEVQATTVELQNLSYKDYKGAPLVAKIVLKEFTKLGRSSPSKTNSIIRVFRDLPNGTISTIPVNQISAVIKSNAWLDQEVRLVVFKSLYDSAVERNLAEKLKLYPIPRMKHADKEDDDIGPSDQAAPGPRPVNSVSLTAPGERQS